LQARRIEIVEQMAPGFELGEIYGSATRAMIHHFAKLTPKPEIPTAAHDHDYARAYQALRAALAKVTLNISHGDPNSVEDFVEKYVREMLCRSAGLGHYSYIQPEQEELSVYREHVWPMIRAAMSGTPIPKFLTDYWGISDVEHCDLASKNSSTC
jgi:hypothetical protein